MLNSAIAKSIPQLFSTKTTFLNKVLCSQMPTRNFASSVAFNVKSKFEDAFLKKKLA